jgi:hypothetical protein
METFVHAGGMACQEIHVTTWGQKTKDYLQGGVERRNFLVFEQPQCSEYFFLLLGRSVRLNLA